jgi:hypothetical protein
MVMSNTQDDARLVPIFKSIAIPNEAQSKLQGRPIFDDMEVVEIRFGGDRQKISVFPAHEFSGNFARPDGTTEALTYAQRWPEQYKRFKQNKTQVMDGTPVDELPFITQAQRSMLKALNIYTAETLALLDGEQLKSLGPDGRELKNQATAYIENASGSADVTRLASENESLREQLAALQAENKARGSHGKNAKAEEPEEEPVSEFEELTVDDLKDYLQKETGERPRGNPNKATLVKMAEEVKAGNAD